MDQELYQKLLQVLADHNHARLWHAVGSANTSTRFPSIMKPGTYAPFDRHTKMFSLHNGITQAILKKLATIYRPQGFDPNTYDEDNFHAEMRGRLPPGAPIMDTKMAGVPHSLDRLIDHGQKHCVHCAKILGQELIKIEPEVNPEKFAILAKAATHYLETDNEIKGYRTKRTRDYIAQHGGGRPIVRDDARRHAESRRMWNHNRPRPHETEISPGRMQKSIEDMDNMFATLEKAVLSPLENYKRNQIENKFTYGPKELPMHEFVRTPAATKIIEDQRALDAQPKAAPVKDTTPNTHHIDWFPPEKEAAPAKEKTMGTPVKPLMGDKTPTMPVMGGPDKTPVKPIMHMGDKTPTKPVMPMGDQTNPHGVKINPLGINKSELEKFDSYFATLEKTFDPSKWPNHNAVGLAMSEHDHAARHHQLALDQLYSVRYRNSLDALPELNDLIQKHSDMAHWHRSKAALLRNGLSNHYPGFVFESTMQNRPNFDAYANIENAPGMEHPLDSAINRRENGKEFCEHCESHLHPEKAFAINKSIDDMDSMFAKLEKASAISGYTDEDRRLLLQHAAEHLEAAEHHNFATTYLGNYLHVGNNTLPSSSPDRMRIFSLMKHHDSLEKHHLKLYNRLKPKLQEAFPGMSEVDIDYMAIDHIPSNNSDWSTFPGTSHPIDSAMEVKRTPQEDFVRCHHCANHK